MPCCLTILLLLAAPLWAQIPAAVKPLPPQLTPQAADAGRKVWHTRFFRIDSDIHVSDHDLKQLASVADTTARAVRSHPLPLFAPPPGERPRIRIHGDQDTYLREGAARGTAGMYVWRTGTVLLDATHLFPRHPGSRLQPMADQDLIVHELVHLCMHRVQHRVPQWFAEGIAEYFSCAHLGNGRFSFRDMNREIREHLRRRFPDDTPKIPLVAISEIATLDARDWLTTMAKTFPADRYRYYATSLLVTHYYIHGNKERRSEVSTALNQDRRDPALLNPPGPSTRDALTRYWKSEGLNLHSPP